MFAKFIVFIVASAVVLLVANSTPVFLEKGIFDRREDYVKSDAFFNADSAHEVVFAIKQNNLDKLERILYQVSDPKSPMFGKHLNRKQVANLTSNVVATDSILTYLNSNGAKITKKSPHGEYISAVAPVSLWEKIFSTKFHAFKHVENAHAPIFRAYEYSVDSDIELYVSAVFNTVQLPSALAPRKIVKRKSSQSSVAATGTITPAVLNSYYDITTNTGNSGASQAVFESLGQYYSPSDLAIFQTNYGIPADPVDTDIGGYVSDTACVSNPNNCVEANLDVQYMIAISQVTPTTYWYEDATDSFLAWVQAVAASENPPLVNSISYGAVEPSLPKSVVNAFNTEAMKLGVQGVTITVSSGDDGVANFQARQSPSSCGYNPSFPASSPYVTAIGATQGPESGTTEIACSHPTGGLITTGGGFSTKFTAPAYQTAAVAAYFAGLPANQQPASGYAATGRGYPDISMAGFNYEVVVGGATYEVSGTSASSPVIAGMVSLVNAARIKAGKSALGFLNPSIYAYGTTFVNDITSGENNCCASAVCCTEGFYAAKGWDPLTGFGSVNYAKFYNVFFNL